MDSPLRQEALETIFASAAMRAFLGGRNAQGKRLAKEDVAVTACAERNAKLTPGQTEADAVFVIPEEDMWVDDVGWVMRGVVFAFGPAGD